MTVLECGDRRSVLISAYRCDPNGLSEAYSGFMSALVASKQSSVVLATPRYNLAAVEARLAELGEETRAHITLLPISVPAIDSRLGLPGALLKPGFWIYDRRLLRRLRQTPCLLESLDVVWHRTPVTHRFRTSLWRLDVPLIIGPISGGVHPPSTMRDYFKDEGFIYSLRRFDGALLRSRFWMKPFRHAATILGTAEYVRELLPADLAARLRVIPEIAIDPKDASETSPRRSGPFRVLFVGRLVRYKGPLLAVRAFAQFLKTVGPAVDAQLIMVGDGAERAACERECEEQGIQSRVLFTGTVDRESAAREYESADVFLFPSIKEAAGNVFLEAMREGVPLVVMDHGGGRYIPCDDCCIRVSPGPTETVVRDLAAALVKLYEEPETRERMARAGKACIRESYSWDVLERSVGQVIEEVAT
jgi:glycosyltransferase involved in cell wall biosynthesis